jgi:all-trans-retinol dehydrogenase (NAD+)
MIVTIASLASYVSAPNLVDYAGSKAAALAFHEGLTAELATRYKAPRVRTVCVNPGFINTELWRGGTNVAAALTPTLHPETVSDAIAAQILSGRSGHLILPVGGNVAINLRGLPTWLQLSIRQGGEKGIKGWNGRQVIDPNAK